MAVKRKIYDRSFKLEAVLLSYKKGNIADIVKQLGITVSLLTRWRREYQEFGTGSFPGINKLKIPAGQEEIYTLEKQLKDSELNFEILKKGTKCLLAGKITTYEFIQKNEKMYTVIRMCSVLGISERSYRRWKRHPVTEAKKRKELIKEKISYLFFKSKKRFGPVRIAAEMHKHGLPISSKLTAYYMKQLGLRKKIKRMYKITTDSKHNLYTAPNILNQQFTVSSPSAVWVSDITYIALNKRFLYLTVIMDLFDRKIIGWNLSSRLTAAETSLLAWEMAVSRRIISSRLLFHSDRGVQYACKAFTSKLNSYECVTRSMSRKGNSYDNAVSESFFSSIKRELIYPGKLLTKVQMKAEIYEYIENWYNKKRRHSALDYKTIEEFNSMNG